MIHTTKSKACRACGEVKALTEFYGGTRPGYSIFPDCKPCHCAKTRRYRNENDEVRKRDRERNRKRRSYRADLAKHYAENNREKRAAHAAVSRAVRSGLLKKQPCEVCGSSDVHAHHEDYGRALDVTWLCPRHHAQLHAQKMELET